MGNFTVNVTTILGTDSMNNSRVTINNNFELLAQSVNAISDFFNGNAIGSTNSSFTGASLTAGGVSISGGSIQIGNNVTISGTALTVGGQSFNLTEANIQKLNELVVQ